MKKIVAIVLVLAMVLTACGQKTEKKPEPSKTGTETTKDNGNKKDEPAKTFDRDLVAEGLPAYNEKIASLPDTTMEVWFAADYVNEAPIVDAINEFMEVYPNITVKRTGFNWGDMADKVRLAVTGGAAPDLAHQHAFSLGNQGLAEPVDDLWAEWGEEEAAKFLPGAMTDITWKGVKYGMPLDINTTFLFYNKKIYEEMGITPPTTFEELIEVAKKTSKPNGERFGFVGSASGWGLFGLVKALGTDLLSEDLKQVKLNDPSIVDLVSRYTGMATKDKSAPVPPPQKRQTDHPVAMFGTERAVSFISGPWDLARIKKEFPDSYQYVGTAPIPGKQVSSVAGGGSLFVPKGAKNREASFELMKWFVSDKYSIRMAEEMGRHPVKGHVYENDFFKDPLLKPYIDTLKSAKPYYLEAYPEASSAWYKAIRAAFDGADVEETLNKAQKDAQRAIDEF